MKLLLLFGLLTAAEPKLELRAPDRLGEPAAGSPPPVLYTGEPPRKESSDHRLYFIAGGILIVIAIYLTTRQRKPAPADADNQEPGNE